jgi:hydrogenase maturation factor
MADVVLSNNQFYHNQLASLENLSVLQRYAGLIVGDLLAVERDAAIIGEVVADHPGCVTMKTRVGGNRVVDVLSGEQLPRIC